MPFEAGTRAPRRRPARRRATATPKRGGDLAQAAGAGSHPPRLARAISGGHWQPEGGGEEPDWGAGATDGGPAANPAGIKLASGAGRALSTLTRATLARSLRPLEFKFSRLTRTEATAKECTTGPGETP
jgi:hypothetical protein